MPTIQANAGFSLANIYDVKGSKILITELVSPGGIHLFHEMGDTIFSERYQQQVFRATSGAIGQNLDWTATFTIMPETPTRILGIMVLQDVTSRMLRAQVSLNITAGTDRDFPFWVWDGTNEDSVRIQEEGTVANLIALRPQAGYGPLPTMFPGTGQPAAVDGVIARGTTSGFGAGDVTTTVLLHLAMAERQAVGSRGLPIPSW